MITSTQNDKIKALVKLRAGSGMKDSILIDGLKNIQTAIKAGVEISAVFHSGYDIPAGLKQDTQVYEVAKNVFRKISYGDIDEGCVAEAQVREKSLESLPENPDGCYIILERIEKPGNIGAVLRTADASGVSAVIVCDPKTSLYNPNIIRASIGTCFNVPYIGTGSASLKQFTAKRKINCYSLTPSGSMDYQECIFKRPCAIIAGNEHAGLSQDWLSGGVSKIRIPMLGSADSLNISVAVSVVAYEELRQRRIHKKALNPKEKE